MAKSAAVKLVRSLARRAGFSERQYDVRGRARAGICELWLRRKVGLRPPSGLSTRATEVRVGFGRTWTEAARWAFKRAGLYPRVAA